MYLQKILVIIKEKYFICDKYKNKTILFEIFKLNIFIILSAVHKVYDNLIKLVYKQFKDTYYLYNTTLNIYLSTENFLIFFYKCYIKFYHKI